MIRKTVLLAVLAALAPAALLAADPAATGSRGERPGGDGDLFQRFDTNHDGAISKEEAANGRLAKAFDHIDTNHDGFITQDEMQAASGARREERRAALAARFKEADKNGDGLISKEEAAAAMPRLAQRFDSVDTNKDGQLSPEEFAAMARHMRHHARKGETV
jgi:Ca2+-binding EF-hand superfamily protein